MSIQGKVVIFTGKISKPRHEFQALVESNGGIAGVTVTRDTDYLVVGEDPGSKLARAVLLGTVKIISENDLLKLIDESKAEVETPATPAELEEINRHNLILNCKWCKKTYRQWDTLPNTQTCPVCELLSNPNCPHCDNDNPIYITNFNIYKCMACGRLFEAPCSTNRRTVKHLHLFILGTPNHKKCPCGASIILTDEDIAQDKKQYEEVPGKVKKWRLEEERLIKRQEEQATRRLADEKALTFIESLTDEQRKELKKELSAGLIN